MSSARASDSLEKSYEPIEGSSLIGDEEGAPKHALITEMMTRQIALGRWLPGHKLPSDAELMQHFNVSRITIRRALQDLSRDGLLVGRQGKGTYVNASKAARALNILFVHGEESAPTYPYTAQLLEGVRAYGEHASPPFRIELVAMKHVYLQSADDSTIEELVTYGRHHGIIAMPRIHSHAIKRLHQRGSSIVLVGGTGRQALPSGTTLVDSCREPDALDIGLEHLTSIGRNKVGVILGTHPEDFEKLLAQVQRWIPAFSASHWEVAGWGINAGAAAAERLLARAPDINAIFAQEDLLALGALHTLWKRGVSVPRDIAVLGIGNQLGEQSHCGLSTVDIRTRDMGYTAAETLYRMLQDLPVRSKNEIPATLIRRESTSI